LISPDKRERNLNNLIKAKQIEGLFCGKLATHGEGGTYILCIFSARDGKF